MTKLYTKQYHIATLNNRYFSSLVGVGVFSKLYKPKRPEKRSKKLPRIEQNRRVAPHFAQRTTNLYNTHNLKKLRQFRDKKWLYPSKADYDDYRIADKDDESNNFTLDWIGRPKEKEHGKFHKLYQLQVQKKRIHVLSIYPSKTPNILIDTNLFDYEKNDRFIYKKTQSKQDSFKYFLYKSKKLLSKPKVQPVPPAVQYQQQHFNKGPFNSNNRHFQPYNNRKFQPYNKNNRWPRK